MDLDVSSMGRENPHKPDQPGTLKSECRGVEEVSAPRSGERALDKAAARTGQQDAETAAGADAADAQVHWYALKVFYNRVPRVRELFSTKGFETYVAMQVLERVEKGRLTHVEKPAVAGLLFVRCDETTLLQTKYGNDNLFLCYYNRGCTKPAVIRDEEMATFIRVTSVGDPGLKFLGEDTPELRKGQRVRVKSGMYEGIEGRVRKIGSDRRVLVALSGVTVVALSFIHPSYLEPVDA